MTHWGAIMPTRNNHATIARAVQSALDQTIPPVRVIVVNDGSTDGTDRVLNTISDTRLFVIHTRNTTTDYSRLPVLFNEALAHLPSEIDHHMILAGDVRFNRTYVETIVDEMRDRSLVVASGRISPNDRGPQGAGRLVDHQWFRQHYPNGYIHRVGYESEIAYRALYTGRGSGIVEIPLYHDDDLGRRHNFAEWGAGMRPTGYHPWRLLLTSWQLARHHSLRDACSFVKSYMTWQPDSAYYSYWDEDIRRYIRAQTGPYLTFRRWCSRRLAW